MQIPVAGKILLRECDRTHRQDEPRKKKAETRARPPREIRTTLHAFNLSGCRNTAAKNDGLIVSVCPAESNRLRRLCGDRTWHICGPDAQIF
jgi:hypothetical protein